MIRSNMLLAACAILLFSACGEPTLPTSGPAAGLRILEFTVLGDTAIAVRMQKWRAVDPPAGESVAWDPPGFAVVDRRDGTVRGLDTLPFSSAPTFPSWFFACDSGQPVSVHPPGREGPPGTCADGAQAAVSPLGIYVLLPDSQSVVHLMSGALDPTSTRSTGADSVLILRADEGRGTIHILESHGDRRLWRSFIVDDPSSTDSAWLDAPIPVRVKGEGTRLVCGEADAAAYPSACWTPEGLPRFRAALAEAAAGPVPAEWDPAAGVLAYTLWTGRFVFLDPGSGDRTVFDAGGLLASFRF